MSQPPFPESPQIKALRWRLLLSSLGVIGCTLALFAMVVYQVVAQSLEQKAERQLKILAEAAAHSLSETVATPGQIADRAPNVMDNDGDLDIPWQDLQQPQQSVEWFDANGDLLQRAGRFFPEAALLRPAQPLKAAARPSASPPDRPPATDRDAQGKQTDALDRHPEDGDQLHTLTLPVYGHAAAGVGTQLRGYVRVSESDEAVEEELERLRLGLQWGSVLALGLSALGGGWLTRQSLQPIDRSIRQLKQFTADASHELRNPLTAIQASVEVMQTHQERFQPADLHKLAAIASATHQMSQMVDDLLWLARSDRVSLASPAPLMIPLTDLLEEVVDQYLAQAAQKQIVLKMTEFPEISVLGEPSQLKRLFGNLIANAVHYTPAGGLVTLSAGVQDDEVWVQVTDTGIGIAPEQVPFVFDRFWRADQARAWREGGSGLGLAIAWAIAHQHRGQITVRSQPGQGSCFQVELPVA